MVRSIIAKTIRGENNQTIYIASELLSSKMNNLCATFYNSLCAPKHPRGHQRDCYRYIRIRHSHSRKKHVKEEIEPLMNFVVECSSAGVFRICNLIGISFDLRFSGM